MSYIREVTCPLCMEVMDMTDQQFRPCNCGYQICVWCWNHMVEEAEKDEVLCPACQNPYDKEKIKGMTVSRDRLIEFSKVKQKMQKAKSKTPEGRYDPDENRVIQRNLVYITGIPVKLANEETLRKREYFGQYGKILKVFIKPSKPGSPHHAKSSAAYITFSMEEEAVRCIQHVNGFILNGIPLNACYGTSRYCISFLLKKPCRNQDCAYLHYAVPQGDICRKDEVTSVCTSKLRQSLRSASLIQRRSGSVLPPMDFSCTITETPLVSSITSSPVDSGGNLRSGESEKSISPSRSSSRGLPVTDRAFNASGTAREEPFNTSNMSNSSITLTTVMKSHALEQDHDEHGCKEIVTPGGQRQFLGGLQNHESSQQYCQNSYPLEHTESTFEANPVNNIVIKNTVVRPSYLWDNDMTKRTMPDSQYLYSSGFKQQISIEADLTKQASSSILHSATNGVSCILSAQSREWSAVSMQDCLISDLQAMSLRSVSASQKVPPHVNWSSGSSHLELMTLASRYEPKDTSPYSDGTGACHISATIGRRVGEFSASPYNAVGTSCPEQEKLHARYSGCYMEDLKNFEVYTNNGGYSTTDAFSDSQHLFRPCQSAPTISKSAVSPPSTSPPGFPTRPSSCRNTCFNFCGNQPVVNSSQVTSRSNSYFSVEPIDVLNRASNYRSIAVGSDGNGHKVPHQPSVRNAPEDPIEVDQTKNYTNETCSHGSWEACTFGRQAATDSGRAQPWAYQHREW